MKRDGVRAAVSIGALMALTVSGFTACESAAARTERERARARLGVVEKAIAEKLPARASPAEVRALLATLGVACEPNPLPGEMTAYLGEWQGPFFRRGLHLIFYFDGEGGLVKYEAREVEGS